MKNLIFIALFSITAYLGLRYYKGTKVVELPKYQNLSCQGHSFDTKVKFTSSIYLLNRAIPVADEQFKNELYRSSIFYQNLYPFTNGQLINFQGPLKWTSLGSRPNIKIINTEAAEYPFNAEFEQEKNLVGFLPEQKEYLGNLFSFGNVVKGEPSTKVNYEYENDLKICLTSNNLEVVKDLLFPQPTDPYLAYFAVPVLQRRKIESKTYKVMHLTNPCTATGALYASGVSPLAFWYHWRPFLQGTDAEKNTFDCSLFYQEGKSLNKLDITWIENVPEKHSNPDYGRLKDLKRPIYASVHFGAYNSTNFKPFEEKKVEQLVHKFLGGMNVNEAKENLPSVTENYDYAFDKLVILLWGMSNHLQVINTNVESGKYHFVVTVQGKLKLSKKDLELKLTFSRNAPGHEGSEFFSEKFANDLVNKDILIYDGHASYGGIFSGALNKLHSNNLQPNKDLNYQLLALYSCSSAFYFDSSRFSKAFNPGLKRDLIHTGGGYQDVTSNSTLAILSSVDGYLYNEKYVPFAYWAKTYNSDNFYILTKKN
jgi:hypothetical protein